METETLYNFINDVCKNDDTDLDVAIASLQSAIGTLQKEVEKRKNQKRQHLIDDFVNAFKALREANVDIMYDFNIDYAEEAVDETKGWGGLVVLEMDDVKSFTFN